MWEQLLVAACLVLVFEGLLPFISPSAWRRVVLTVAAQNDRAIRTSALATMIVGLVLLYLVN